MLSFVLLVAVLDAVWIGEFGAGATHPTLTGLAILAAAYGSSGGSRSFWHVFRSLRSRQALSWRVWFEAWLFLFTQIMAICGWIFQWLPIDHPVYLAAAAHVAAVAWLNNRAGREGAPSQGVGAN